MRTVECRICHESHVPEMVFATIEPPAHTPILGEPHLINAQVG